MDIPSKYNPQNTEKKWYHYWMDKQLFKSVPDDRESYTIVIPPPNVTGVLHMGHMLNNTIQDILIRRARMMGKNACWVPGTDHASIATEAKVVGKLRLQGIKKSDLTREEFLKYAWEWKEEHGGIILEQLKKLGASCDWERTAFTMDENLSEQVIDVFISLFKKGYIYRGVRMVNWDPQAKTAVSDEEVIYKEEKSKLYYVRYQIDGEKDQWLSIATTRPETILGDTAVCVNPNDKRFKAFIGAKVFVPLVNRLVPVIADDYVDMEFGTGCLKITPAHDENDYEIGKKHNLDTIDIFNEDGTLNESAKIFIGKDRFEVRKLIIPELEKQGHLEKVEDYVNKVGYSERTDVVIEPRLSAQWFIAMKDLAKPALDNVMNDHIKFHPAKYKNLYKHWMENIKDWCISRQLWWGHRIPVYYLPDGDYIVAKSADEALETAKKKTGDNSLTKNDLKQDEDVLDTWASSWLWPMSVFNDSDRKYYYPTSDLVTAPDIIFFWVARMIIAGYEFEGEKPFSNVYYTGMVRDKQGRKMSKSLGNSPDPLDLIQKYGADGVRVGMLLCSPAGNDLLFDESLPEQGRNFANKIWNAFRLVKSWQVDDSIQQPDHSIIAIDWFENKLNQNLLDINKRFKEYRISDALMLVYKLFWDEFSAWYLEIVKPDYQKPIDSETLNVTIGFFDILLHILHPFMPFITEEIWQYINDRKDGESIMISEMPKTGKSDKKVLNRFEHAKEVITFIRNTRKDKQIPNKDQLHLSVKAMDYDNTYDPVIKRMGNLKSLDLIDEKLDGAISFITNKGEYYIPLGDLVDAEQEILRLKEELEYSKGFLNSVMKKLANERFINNAPEKVVEMEKRKKADTEAKIEALEKQIESLT